ncbi:GtrA family protein [Candidatus Magnetomonas plexicatena]|uniref:GtrA family protein n=1 Tax=Candidatus Magnetomonas plexicatena TaxID=2552947 RepID=UPI001C7523FE|nr:GtrA family protein [Nitrospirales bacterium LBB_01]
MTEINLYRKKTIRQFIRFALIGALNTVVDMAILNLETILTGLKTGTPFAVQKALSFLVAVIFSYYLNKKWAFEHKDGTKGGKFSHFVAVSLIGMAVNVASASLVVNIVRPGLNLTWIGDQVWVNIGSLCGTACGLLWNFLGYKFFVFKAE